MTHAALYCLFAVLSRFDQRFAPTLTLNKQYPWDAAQCQRQHLKGHLPDAADRSCYRGKGCLTLEDFHVMF